MEHKRHFDAKTTGMTRNERFLLIPNFTEAACEVIKKLLDPEDPHMIHAFIVFDQTGIIDLGQNINDIDVGKKLYLGTVIDAMPYVKDGCAIIKTLKPIHDFVCRLNFYKVDFSVIISNDSYDKNNIIIEIYLFDPKACRCCRSGHNEFRFVCDKGKPYWM